MPDRFSNLIGDKLTFKDEEVSTASVTSKATAIGLYFSAHWCPPCRGFTPKLADWYNKFKSSDKADDLEIIFVSSDRDASAFNDYYGEQPWHALPFSDRARKDSLSKKFKVSGIPTLVIVDSKTGEVICKNARGKVDEDPTGEKFPWKGLSITDMMKGPILTKQGDDDLAKLIDGKVVGLYFSAHWCPPCRTFTPQLIKAYNKMREADKNLEIIFVSWDKSEQQFDEYYGEMPWLSYPMNDLRAKGLATHFEIDGIPSLVILDENRKLVTTNGRAAVSVDPEGKDFPWHPKPLNELSSIASGLINEAASLVYLTGECTEEVEKAARDMMKPIAESYLQACEENPDLEPLNFFYECKNSDDLPESLRKFAHLPPSPLLFIINIPDQKKYVHDNVNTITGAEIQDVVHKFKTSTLTMKPLTS